MAMINIVVPPHRHTSIFAYLPPALNNCAGGEEESVVYRNQDRFHLKTSIISEGIKRKTTSSLKVAASDLSS